MIPWSKLHNPILSETNLLLKDPAVVHDPGSGWFYVFTHRAYRTRDFLAFEELRHLRHLRSQPDITRRGDTWYMATNGPGLDDWPSDTAMPQHHLSEDLETWISHGPLLPTLPAGRHIDPALAWVGGFAFVALKSGQTPQVARMRAVNETMEPGLMAITRLHLSGGGWLGDWLGRLAGGHWGEQFQFVQIDGWWHLLTTGRRYDPLSLARLAKYPYTGNHHPFLYRKRDSGNRLQDWQTWVGRRELAIPRERWNSAMHANGAYLCDWRHLDGHWYCFYAGSAEHTAFNRRGHGKLGVARSRDLRTWRVAGDG